MADLTELQAAQTVKIAGANASTGAESNFATVDASGNLQVTGPLTDTQLRASGVSVIQSRTGTLGNGVQTAVAGTAVEVVAANASRKGLILTNVGAATVRVGTTGVTATTGFPLAANQTVTFTTPDIPVNAIFAIREGGTSSTILAQEIT